MVLKIYQTKLLLNTFNLNNLLQRKNMMRFAIALKNSSRRRYKSK